MQWPAQVFDKLSNVLASIGITGRDKATMTQWGWTPLSVEQIEYAYRGDWITRKIIDIPAQDSTRAWRSWQAEDTDITKLEETERNFDLQNKVYEALRLARLYGGSCIIFGGGDNAQDDMTKPLNLDRVKSGWLKFIHVFGRWNVGTGPLIRDILDPWFGEPAYYSPTALIGESLPLLQIHPSWVVRFWGAPYSDPLRAFDPWADSVLQAINEAIQNAGIVGGAIANMVYEGKFDVIKIPRLTELANTDDGQNMLMQRWSSVNAAKSYVNSIVIDAEEDWQRVTTQFTGMEKVLQTYLMIASGAADIPATRMLGQAPIGMNATGDSDTRNYYDRLQSDQITKIKPRLVRLDEVLARSSLGRRPPELHYDWNPLWQMDAKDKALIDYQKAQAAQIDATIGLVPAHALAIGRQNQLIEDGVYPGLEQAIQEAKEQGDFGSGEVTGPDGKRLEPEADDQGSKGDKTQPVDTPGQETAKGERPQQPENQPQVEEALARKDAGDGDVTGHEFHGNQYAGGGGKPEAAPTGRAATKEKIGEFLSRHGRAAVAAAGAKLKEHHKELLGAAVTGSLYHLAGIDFPADVEHAIREEVEHFADNAKISTAMARDHMRKTVARLTARRRRGMDTADAEDPVLEALLRLEEILAGDEVFGELDKSQVEAPPGGESTAVAAAGDSRAGDGADGDIPGHPFRGNQFASAVIAGVHFRGTVQQLEILQQARKAGAGKAGIEKLIAAFAPAPAGGAKIEEKVKAGSGWSAEMEAQYAKFKRGGSAGPEREGSKWLKEFTARFMAESARKDDGEQS